MAPAGSLPLNLSFPEAAGHLSFAHRILRSLQTVRPFHRHQLKGRLLEKEQEKASLNKPESSLGLVKSYQQRTLLLTPKISPAPQNNKLNFPSEPGTRCPACNVLPLGAVPASPSHLQCCLFGLGKELVTDR